MGIEDTEGRTDQQSESSDARGATDYTSQGVRRAEIKIQRRFTRLDESPPMVFRCDP